MNKISKIFLIVSATFLTTCDAGPDLDFDYAAGQIDNNSLGTAQLITNPVTLTGYVNTAGAGEQGLSKEYGDIDDVYQIDAQGGETINLTMPEAYPADVDLYLYDSSENLVDFSLGDGTSPESIKLPATTGIYYIDVRIFDAGASSYQLTIGVDDHAVTATQSEIRTAAASDFVIGDMIVQYESSESDDIGDLLQGASSTSWESGPIPYQFGENIADYSSSLAIKHPTSELELKAATWRKIKAIAKSTGVKYAEPNFIHRPQTTTVNDSDEPWHYANIGLSQNEVNTSTLVKVAVIDTGIHQHDGLEDLILDQYSHDFITDVDNSGLGGSNNIKVIDPGDGNDNPLCQDSHADTSSFHGTHIAGIIGAYRNDENDSDDALPIQIMNLRALGCKGGYAFDIANAIRYAAGLDNITGNTIADPADIINMSLGGSGHSKMVQQAVSAAREQDVIIIAAAGNSSSSKVFYPAAYDGVISVSAANKDRELASYSNYGSDVDISAPGGDEDDGIQSTSAVITENGDIQDATKVSRGTSVATAHVTLVTALMKAKHPALTPGELDLLIDSGAMSESDTSNDLESPEDGNRVGHINTSQAVVSAGQLAEGDYGVLIRAAEAAIETYAADNSQAAPSVEVYAIAGVTGVTKNNLDEVNTAVADGQITKIAQVAAQAVIEAYVVDNTQTAPSADVYTAAEFVGVTDDNVNTVNAAVARGKTIEIAQVAAKAVIEAYAVGNSQAAPSADVYTTAEFVGVTDDNVSAVNAVVASAEDSFDAEALETAIDQTVEQAAKQADALAIIQAYAADSTQALPSADVYTTAEFVGVTNDNVGVVNAAVADGEITKIAQVAAQAVIEAYAADSTQALPSADVYTTAEFVGVTNDNVGVVNAAVADGEITEISDCLLYTSPSPRDRTRSRMPSSA